MNSRAFLAGLSLAFVCACLVQQAEAGWRERVNVAEITRGNPGAQRILDGPLGPVIDIIVEIILYLVDFILGGAFAPIQQFKKLEREVKSMKAMLQTDGGRAMPTLL
ncbi:hypothetical protein EGW08_008823 [Elysia chlorotica]|uniref:Uncharacterized protein n=1 Tax=Elysia chlorotica TaxID=188477 RepID=A0A3S0ZQG9_ELYCH|nr:hypothetical protein EGW08_008823 [Elysia chlorotica]